MCTQKYSLWRVRSLTRSIVEISAAVGPQPKALAVSLPVESEKVTMPSSETLHDLRVFPENFSAASSAYYPFPKGKLQPGVAVANIIHWLSVEPWRWIVLFEPKQESSQQTNSVLHESLPIHCPVPAAHNANKFRERGELFQSVDDWGNV